jgi:hypothetical protein
MALNPNDLYPAEVTRGTQLRVQPAEGPGALVVKTFAANGAAPILKAGTAVYADATTGFWAKVVPAGTAYASATAVEQVMGIIWPTDIQTHATNEVLGTVMLRGSAHVDDVATAMSIAVPLVDANTLLCFRNPVTRYRGIFLEGLTLAK